MNKQYGRVDEWDDFAKIVREHIASYAVDQYKDMNLDNPDDGDQVQGFTIEQIQSQLIRYVKRMCSGARGRTESLRDLLKIAHYAAMTWGKYTRNEVSIDEPLEAQSFRIKSLSELDIIVSNIKASWDPNNKPKAIYFD